MQERQNVNCNSFLHISNDRLKGVCWHVACVVYLLQVKQRKRSAEKKGKSGRGKERGTTVYTDDASRAISRIASTWCIPRNLSLS